MKQLLERLELLGESYSLGELKKVSRDMRSGNLHIPGGAREMGFVPGDAIGYFSNKSNVAGWVIFAATPEEKKEFGVDAKRVFGVTTGASSIAFFDLKKGTFRNIDNEEYVNGKVKRGNPTAYSKILIQNSDRAAKEFGVKF